MPDSDSSVTFPIIGGIFGAGRLATRLKALAATKEIGDWHFGLWVDWRHTAIRVSFHTVADAARAKILCADVELRPHATLSASPAGSRAP